MYALYCILVIDRSSFSAFGDAYAWFYYPGVAGMWALAVTLHLDEGLGLIGLGLLLGPLIGIVAYSFVIAVAVLFWKRIRTHKEHSAI
jgi:hypothetical protein